VAVGENFRSGWGQRRLRRSCRPSATAMGCGVHVVAHCSGMARSGSAAAAPARPGGRTNQRSHPALLEAPYRSAGPVMRGRGLLGAGRLAHANLRWTRRKSCLAEGVPTPPGRAWLRKRLGGPYGSGDESRPPNPPWTRASSAVEVCTLLDGSWISKPGSGGGARWPWLRQQTSVSTISRELSAQIQCRTPSKPPAAQAEPAG